MATVKELKAYATYLETKFGEDAPIAYTVVDKTDIMKMIEDGGYTYIVVSTEMLAKILNHLDRYGVYDLETIDNVLDQINYAESLGTNFFTEV